MVSFFHLWPFDGHLVRILENLNKYSAIIWIDNGVYGYNSYYDGPIRKYKKLVNLLAKIYLVWPIFHKWAYVFVVQFQLNFIYESSNN